MSAPTGKLPAHLVDVYLVKLLRLIVQNGSHGVLIQGNTFAGMLQQLLAGDLVKRVGTIPELGVFRTKYRPVYAATDLGRRAIEEIDA